MILHYCTNVADEWPILMGIVSLLSLPETLLSMHIFVIRVIFSSDITDFGRTKPSLLWSFF